MKGHCVWNTVRNRERAVRISCRYRFWRSLCLFILNLGYPEKSSGKLEGKSLQHQGNVHTRRQVHVPGAAPAIGDH